MKKSIRHYLIIVLAFASCSVYDCSKAEAGLGFLGFSDVETDSIILSRYTRDSNFQKFVDSIAITPSNAGYVVTGDTLTFSHGSGILLLKTDYDYELYFPSIDKRYKITKITEKQESRNFDLACKKVNCVNTMINYEQDGQFSDVQRNTIYIRK